MDRKRKIPNARAGMKGPCTGSSLACQALMGSRASQLPWSETQAHLLTRRLGASYVFSICLSLPPIKQED